MVFFLPLIQTAEAQSDNIVAIKERYEAMPFGPGAVVIPMDEKQNNVILSFGFMHALLRNETICHRLIGPPDSTIKTDVFPLGANYSGGQPPGTIPDTDGYFRRLWVNIWYVYTLNGITGWFSGDKQNSLLDFRSVFQRYYL